MESEQTFFDFAAEVGLTKHIGSVAATQRLVEVCHIDASSRVLDVGCGVGTTAVWLARHIGCHVVGVDIRPRMVERATGRALKAHLEAQVGFRQADVQSLPFDDAAFDAVLSESVTAFPQDKLKAVREYARVTRRGGHVGLNETVWLKQPVPAEILAWVAQDVGATVQPLTAEGWAELLRASGLRIVVTRSFEVDARAEARGMLQRYGLAEVLRIVGRMVALYKRSPDYRRFVRATRRSGVVPPDLQQYFGYGLFVGQK